MLINSIKKRVDGLKNYTTYLSGGIDSSIITSISKKYNNNLKESFNIDFLENGEKIFAKEVSDGLNLKLNSYLFTDEQLINSLDNCIYYSEGLSINKHFPAKYLLNEIIKKRGYDVILSGEGSDEFFIGYPHFNKYFRNGKKIL
jgi:asparagine synthase (glutamine-hydrolysing)